MKLKISKFIAYNLVKFIYNQKNGKMCATNSCCVCSSAGVCVSLKYFVRRRRKKMQKAWSDNWRKIVKKKKKCQRNIKWLFADKAAECGSLLRATNNKEFYLFTYLLTISFFLSLAWLIEINLWF